MRGMIFVMIILSTILSLPISAGEWKLPAIFSDHMILQNSDATPIWGWAEKREMIMIRYAGRSAQAKSDESGRWQTKLDTTGLVGKTFEITIQGEKSSKTIVDVAVGEVWLTAGQSNMEKPVGYQRGQRPCIDWEKEVMSSNNPSIRYFVVKANDSAYPSTITEGAWQLASPATTASFSALSYFFAREINKELQVPVGIVHSSWGGTRIEPWIPFDAYAKYADLKAYAQQEIDAAVLYPESVRIFQKDIAEWATKYHYQEVEKRGEKEGWAKLEAPWSDWSETNLKDSVVEPGVRWYRTELTIPYDWRGKPVNVNLESLPGLDTVFYNGIQIGKMEYSHQVEKMESNRHYTIPANLVNPGKSALAIKLIVLRKSFGILCQPGSCTLSCSSNTNILKLGIWKSKQQERFPLIDETTQKSLPVAPKIPLGFDTATYLFNGKINPIIPYRFAGILWYQGESNSYKPNGRLLNVHPNSALYKGSDYAGSILYRRLLPSLISGWREAWQKQGGQAELPFYYCQLPNYEQKHMQPVDSGWAEVREAERLTLQKEPNTGMAVLIDIGEESDIHPINKQEVGHRMALVALAKNYGRKIEWSGPLVESAKLGTNDSVILEFTHIADGLIAGDLPETYQKVNGDPKSQVKLIKPCPTSQLQGFEVCGWDGKFFWADAKIDGEVVIVHAPEVKHPVRVRYAWSDNPTCNLFNTTRLPASPFQCEVIR